jgi:hypothetical protein
MAFNLQPFDNCGKVASTNVLRSVKIKENSFEKR